MQWSKRSRVAPPPAVSNPTTRVDGPRDMIRAWMKRAPSDVAKSAISICTRLSADREFVQADSLRPLRALVDQNDLGVEPAAGKPRQGRQAGVAPAKDHDPMATHVTNPSPRVSVRRHAGQARTLAVNQTCAFARTSALRLRPMRRVISESDVDAREARQDRSAFHIAACIAQVAL